MEIASFIFGFLFCFLNSYFIGANISALWKNAKIERFRSYSLQTLILGTLESCSYFFTFSMVSLDLLNMSDAFFIIGGWLTLKTVSSIWNSKAVLMEVGEKYNIFLIGNLMSIISSLFFSYAFNNLNQNYLLVLVPPTLLFILYFEIKYQTIKK